MKLVMGGVVGKEMREEKRKQEIKKRSFGRRRVHFKKKEKKISLQSQKTEYGDKFGEGNKRWGGGSIRREEGAAKVGCCASKSDWGGCCSCDAQF